MELSATKKYNDIVNLLESLEETLESEIKIFQEEFTQKYSLDITKEILQYAADFLRTTISVTIKDVIKDYNWYTILIDCTEINLNMLELEALLRKVRRQIKDKIPADLADDIQITMKKYLRKVICRIPTRWTEPVVKDFLNLFVSTLDKLGIITD